MKITSVSLPTELTDKIDQAARRIDRSRSWVIRNLLENPESRLDALKQIADAGLEAYHAPRERAPNATDVIADSCDEGRRRLAALEKIAKGAK